MQVAALNACVLYQKQQKLTNSREGHRREFLYNLSRQLMDQQQNQRIESAHYLARTYSEKADIDERIHKKVMGEAKSTNFWCSAGKHSARNDEVQKCKECSKNVCANHIVQLILCTTCNKTNNREGKKPATDIPKPSRPATRNQPPSQASGRCHICPPGNKLVTHSRCRICEKYICAAHKAKQDRGLCTFCNEENKKYHG